MATPQVIKERYEAVVIGAGIGGLTTAAVLAHEGVDVLLVEQSHQPGGCCSSLRIEDFTFDTAASILRGFGEVGFHVMRTLFDFLGQQVELIPRDSSYAMLLGEQRVDFFRDRQAYTSELGALFPQQAGSAFAYMRELERLYHAILDCSGPIRPGRDEPTRARLGLFSRHPASFSRVSRTQRISAEKVLLKHLDDPVGRAFFEADYIFNTGYRLSELSAPHAALAAIDRHIGGTHHAIGSAQQVADKLEKSINENGGRVLYRTRVESVLVRDGAAVGVALSDGGMVFADAVVADTSHKQLFSGLVSPEHLKQATVEWAASLEPEQGVMAIFMGVPETAVPADINPNTIIVDDPLKDPGRFISVSVPSMFDPNLSPEGFHSVSIHGACDPGDWPSPADAGHPSPRYLERRESEAADILQRLSPLLPDIESQAVVTAVMTPTAFERISGREMGALAAPRPPAAIVPASLPGCVTEIKGLFVAGDSTFFGRGVAEAAACGIHCSLELLRQMRLKAPRFHRRLESFVLETVPVRPQISGQQVVDSISAVLESHRCMRCEAAPCRRACPAGVDVPNMMRRVAAADFSGAARVVRESNPFGEVCAAVCPAGDLCEAACNRAGRDGALKIGQMEGFVCGFTPGPVGWPESHRGPRRQRVAVIGSGPAGLSCAFYLSMLGRHVVVFDEAVQAGGLPANAMTDFRLEKRVLRREIEAAMGPGVEFKGNTTFGEDINLEYLWREGFGAVFLAAGLQDVTEPRVRGLDMPGAIDALSFLSSARRRVKRELSESVAVLGGGDLAVDAALLALEMGAREVFLVTRDFEKALEARPERLAQARDGGVKVLSGRKIIEVKGDGRVESLLAPVRPDSPGESTDDNAEAAVLKVGTVVYAGDREIAQDLAGYLAGQLKMTAGGRVEVDPETLETSRPGVFAGGEISSEGENTVVSACAQGRRAALSIDAFMKSESERRQEEPDASS